jgi:hypothetical protein
VLVACDFRVRGTAAAALKQPRAESGADSLARRQLGMRLGEHPLARLTAIPALAPQQVRQAPANRQIPDPHDVAILDRQRSPATPPTTGSPRGQLDLELKPPLMVQHIGHDQPIDPNKTANVILHPLFLLGRVVDNAKPRRGSGCLYPGLNPARSSKTPIFNRR